MNFDQDGRKSIAESVLNFPDARKSGTGDSVVASRMTVEQVAADVITPIAQAPSDNTGTEEPIGGFLPSAVSDGLHDAAIGGPAALHAASPSSSEIIESIESQAGNPMVVAGDVMDVAVTGGVEDIKDRAQALVLTRLGTFISKLPILGPYLVNTQLVGGASTGAPATETTPLLGALRDPKAFATEQAEGLFRHLLSPLLQYLPDVDALDNVESGNHGTLFKVFVESYVFGRDGIGWLFTLLQEHSLVIAPIVSLGNLSTGDLAASAIGSAVASVTGYSIIQGFISSLDKVLASSPNRRISKIACAQATVVTGIALFPITHLWTVQSPVVLRLLGQSPEVIVLASKFLQIAVAGLPGHAIGEIAKRYLTSQGLSSVHTRILSVTAPLNLCLNYLLVDGPIPALRLGFAGAPLCTVISHNVLSVMLILYIVLREVCEEIDHLRGQNVVPDEPVSVNDNSGPSCSSSESDCHPQLAQDQSNPTFYTGLGSLVFAGLGGISKSASQVWSKDFGGGESGCSVVASMLGPDILAAQAVLHATATTLYQIPKAMSNVSSNRITKWMIDGDVQRAKIAACVGFVGTFGGVIVIGNVLLTFATSWASLFNKDPAVLEIVSTLLPFIAFFQAIQGIGVWADGSLGALGKAAVFPSVSASADYFLGIPLGVYLAFRGEWGLAGLWAGLTVSLACSCFVALVTVVTLNWKGKVGAKGKRAEREEDRSIAQRGQEGIISV